MIFRDEDGSLDRLVERFVLAREEAGLSPDLADETEGGLTDYPYVAADPGPELRNLMSEIVRKARGKKVWMTKDGIGYRFFFGELSEIKRRVQVLQESLLVQEVLDA